MRPIKIGFSSPIKNMIGAELIQMWISRPYSHSFVQFTSRSLGISTVYQAAHGMVHFRELNNFTKDNKIVKEYSIDLTDEQYDKFMTLCMKLAGEPYGYKELFIIFIHDILFKVGIRLKSRDGVGYICSELVGSLCADILGIKFDKPTYLLTPSDVDRGLELWINQLTK